MAEYTLQPSPLMRAHKSTTGVSVTGSWTPTMTCGTPGDLSITYGASTSGYYIRIGDLLILNFVLSVLPTFTTASGTVSIKGRPFYEQVLYPAVGSLYTSGITYPVETCNLALAISSGVDSLPIIATAYDGTAPFVQMSYFTSGGLHTIAGQLSMKISTLS